MAPAIETEKLTKRFGRARGVEELSLTVPHGEVFGFLGPNGAGKTTTIRMLLGLAGILLVLALAMQITSWVFGARLGVGHTLAAVLALWALGAFAGGVAALLAGASDRSFVVNGGATALLVAAYFVDVLARVSDTVDAVDWLSPFHYYGTAITDGVDVAACSGLVLAGVVLTVGGCALFERRDVAR